jgi:hypothetical protein
VARSIVWPQMAPEAETAPHQALPGVDLAGLAAAFGPELARRMGLRITATPDRRPQDPLQAPLETVLLARIPLAGHANEKQPIPQALLVGCTPDCAAMLLERLFGARAADAASAHGSGLLTLPPGSASWLALCRTVSSALAAALGAVGLPPGGSPALPPRAVPIGSGPMIALSVDADGCPCRMLLAPEAAKAAPPPSAPDKTEFRQAARARVFDLELPVALRIAERRISLEQASRLAVGDILPIDPVQSLDVLAGGHRIARLPASAFAPPISEPGSGE